MDPFLAAAVQLGSTSNEAENRLAIERQTAAAAQAGAALIVTPENATFLGPHREKVRRAEPLDGPTVAWAAGLARRHQVHFVLGSFAERTDDPQRCANTTVVLAPDGALLGSYRKIHLFDVDYPPHVVFRESATVVPGNHAVVVPTALGRLGLAICYDLRFPELFVALSRAGADLIVLPAASTAPTGRAHWEVLVRARAIESQCPVVAAAQHGHHDDEGLRESWGHSMVVDAWGSVLAVLPAGEGLALGLVDYQATQVVRSRLPIAEHRRKFGV